MDVKFFKNQQEFRKWLEKNHQNESELWVGYYKISSGKQNMTWSESVDQALCFGWIDGIRKSINHESYCNRFTPRRPNSNWSDVNIQKVETLIEKGLMMPAGLEIYNKRREAKSRVYSFENKAQKLPEAYVKLLKANTQAYDFFSAQAPSYQKTIFHWILSAKQEKTQISRLEKLIQTSEQQKKIVYA